MEMNLITKKKGRGRPKKEPRRTPSVALEAGMWETLDELIPQPRDLADLFAQALEHASAAIGDRESNYDPDTALDRRTVSIPKASREHARAIGEVIGLGPTQADNWAMAALANPDLIMERIQAATLMVRAIKRVRQKAERAKT